MGGWRPTLFGVDIGRAYTRTQASGVVDLPQTTRPRSISDDGNIVTSLLFSGFSPTAPWIDVKYTAESRNMLEFLATDFGFDQMKFTPGSHDPLGIVSGDGTVFTMSGAKWVTKTTPINFVSLGDSYSSGEGVEQFEPVSNAPNNQCHRSLEAYATLVRPRSSTSTLKGLASTKIEFTWKFLACSGAVAQNVSAGPGGFGQYPGTADASPQLAQGFVDLDTDLVTVTIGGNDLQFEKFTTACGRQRNCPKREALHTGKTWDEYLPGLIMDFSDDAEALYAEIKAAAPNAYIVALGYPLLVSGMECADLEVELPFLPDPGFSSAEQKFIRKMAKLLNRVLESAAKVAGIHFLDVAKPKSSNSPFTFAGHEACSADPWINGIVDKPNRIYSLHPNKDGQMGYANALNHHLTQTGIGHVPGFWPSGLPKNRAPQP